MEGKEEDNNNSINSNNIVDNANIENLIKIIKFSCNAENITPERWLKEGQKIIFSNKKELSMKEREILKRLLIYELPIGYRSQFWLLCSGAKREMASHPGYFDSLTKYYPDDVPSPFEHQIDLDIGRTFPEQEYFQNEEVLFKLKHILLAYSRRCIKIGYCQGFNFIAGKILEICDNEEESFWIFTQVIERILPMNYYTELCGMMIDNSIVLRLLKENFEEIFEVLESNGAILYLNNLINKWLLSLFFQGTSPEYQNLIWDFFLLEGNIVIFKVCYALIKQLKHSILNAKSLEELHKIFEKKPDKFKIREKLLYYLITKKFNFNMKLIKSIRLNLHDKVIKEILDLGDFSNPSKSNKKKDNENCDLNWPICTLDNKYRNEICEFITLKEISQPIVIENYFDNEFKKTKNYKEIKKSDKIYVDKSDKYFKEKIFANILIERRNHYCNSNNKSIETILEKYGNNNDESKMKDVDEKELLMKRRKTVSMFRNDMLNEKISRTDSEQISKIVNEVESINKNLIKIKKEKIEKNEDIDF